MAKYDAINDATYAVIGAENLRKPKIKDYIETRKKEIIMDTDEILARLTQQARGPDVTEFSEMVEISEKDDDGNFHVYDIRLKINLEKIKELGIGHLIKKLSQTSTGIAIEWHNPQRALEMLGKHHKLFTERIEHDLSDEMKQHVENFNKTSEAVYGAEADDQ